MGVSLVVVGVFEVVCAWDFGFCVAGCVLITVWWVL